MYSRLEHRECLETGKITKSLSVQGILLFFLVPDTFRIQRILSFLLFLLDWCWIRSPPSWAPQVRSEAWEVYPLKLYHPDNPSRASIKIMHKSVGKLSILSYGGFPEEHQHTVWLNNHSSLMTLICLRCKLHLQRYCWESQLGMDITWKADVVTAKQVDACRFLKHVNLPAQPGDN